MAATVTRDGEVSYASFPITKTEVDPEGNVLVYGKASDDSIDSDGQVIDADFAAKAINEWLNDGANVRVQHNPQRDPAGVGIAMDTDEHGGTWVKSKIIEPIAQKLVLGGALRAYSVGIAKPQIVRDASARGGRITGGQVVEISLVDRPANKNCSVQIVKAAKDGTPKFTGKVLGDGAFITKAVRDADLVKVGPHGYVHGWIKVGSPEHKAFNKLDATSQQHVAVHLDAASEAKAAGDRAEVSDRLDDAANSAVAGGAGSKLVNSLRSLSRTEFGNNTQKGAGAMTAPAVEKTVTLELPEDVSVAFSPADLQRIIAKRKSSNVGEDLVHGGVDRDKMPGEDFAGRNRSFPIHSPGDVADAAQSIGRAGDDNYSSDQLKANITRIAHRKGSEYVAQLPDAWKDGDDGDNDDGGGGDVDTAQKSLAARELLVTKYGWDDDYISKLSDEALGVLMTATEEAEVTKGKKKPHEDEADAADDADAGAGAGADEDEDEDEDASNDGDDEDEEEDGKVEKGKKPFKGAAPPFGSGKWDDDDEDEDADHGASADTSDGDDDDADSKAEKGLKCKLCNGTGKIREGHVACPKCKGKGVIGAVEKGEVDDYQPKPYDSGGEGAGEPVTCPRCGKGDAADARYCDQCGFKLQGADGVVVKAKKSKLPCGCVKGKCTCDDGVIKGKKPGMCLKCGGGMKAKHTFCPGCGAPAGGLGEVPDKTGAKKEVQQPAVVKAGMKKCAGCGKNYHADAKLKRCENCGKKLPKAADAVEKSGIPNDTRPGNDSRPIPPHREPDGAMMEAYEDDSKVPDDDGATERSAPTHLEEPMLKGDVVTMTMGRLVKSGAPMNLAVLHDLTCPAFSPDSLHKCYPHRTLQTEVDEGWWQQKALDLASRLPFPEAARVAQLGSHAVALKMVSEIDAEIAHAELHKAFSDANPGPGTAPTPMAVTPGAFNRPYLAAGHAAPSPQQGTPNQTPIVSGSIEAAEFQRGPLLAGHEAPSPGNNPMMSAVVDAAIDGTRQANDLMAAMRATSGSTVPGSVPAALLPTAVGAVTGVPNATKGRTYYSNAGKDQAKNAMKAIHDHIAGQFPDLCAMHSEAQQASKMATDAAAQAAKLAPKIPGMLTKSEKRQLKAARQRREFEDLLKQEMALAQGALPEPEVTKAATVAEPSSVEKLLMEQLAGLQEVVANQNKVLKKQAKALDTLERQPDPNVTAYRGGFSPQVMDYIGKAQNTQTYQQAAPAGGMADVAERTKAMMLRELEVEFRNSPDPALREAAWRSILNLRGVG